MNGGQENEVDKLLHELNQRVLADPKNKVKIIQEFYSEQLKAGNGNAAATTLIVRSIVTAREESPTSEAARENTEAKVGAIPIWKKPSFWAAVLPSLAAVIVGYWQFVYKPAHPDDSPRSQLSVFVRNARTQDPIVNAKVSLQTENNQREQTTDSLGSAMFHITKVDGTDWRIYSSCDGYEKRNIRVDGATVGNKVELALSEVARSSTTVKGTAALDTIKGTWEVVSTGDAHNLRIQKGTFDFAPQRDKSILASATFHADDMDVKSSGTATLQGDRLSLSFSATNSAGGSWNGLGDFTLLSPSRLSGRIQSKRGDDIPVTLNKVN